MVDPPWKETAWLHSDAGWTHPWTHDTGLQLTEEPATEAQNITKGLIHAHMAAFMLVGIYTSVHVWTGL